MAAEKLPSQKDSSFPTTIFQGLYMLNFGGVCVLQAVGSFQVKDLLDANVSGLHLTHPHLR